MKKLVLFFAVLVVLLPAWQQAEAAIAVQITDYAVVPSINLDGDGNFRDYDEVIVAVDWTQAAGDNLYSLDLQLDFPADRLQLSRWSLRKCTTETWAKEVSYDNTNGTFRMATSTATAVAGSATTAGVVVYLVFDCSSMYPGDIPRLDALYAANSGAFTDVTNGATPEDTPVISMTYVYGNLTGDQAISALDAALILKAAVGDLDLGSYGNWALALADGSGDGQVTAYDASLDLQMVATTIVALPVASSDNPAPILMPDMTRVVSMSTAENMDNYKKLMLTSTVSVDSLAGIYGAEFYFEVDPRVQIESVGLVGDILNSTAAWDHGFKDGNKVVAIARTKPDEVAGDVIEVDFSLPVSERVVNPVRLVGVSLNEGWPVEIESRGYTWDPDIYGTRIYENYPDPLNPETWMPYRLARGAKVEVVIFDSLGRIMNSFDLGYKDPGLYLEKGRAAHWDGRNFTGQRVASGVYFYRFTAGDFSAVRRMVVIK